MEADTQRRYEEMLTTLETVGWAFIRERLSETAESQDKVLNMDSWDNTCRAQGRLFTLHQMINLSDVLKEEMRMIEELEQEGEVDSLEL